MARLQFLDVFICHAWRYHDDWNRLVQVLDSAGVRWRNFSLPWHDPAIDPNTEAGMALLRRWLEGQIEPAHVVLVPSSVFVVKSARPWLDQEIAWARAAGKPVYAVTSSADGTLAPELAATADGVAPWDSKLLTELIGKAWPAAATA